MTNKTLYYAHMAEEAAKQITSSRKIWTGFLTTAARLYKYPFAEQLMIYTQRPDATACAEYDLWNGTMNRYVKRGSKGIALVDNSGDEPRLRYVFDVSDTGERRNSRPVKLWEMKTEHEEPVRLALIEAFSLGDERLPMLEAITESARVLATAYWEDHKNQILDIVADSYLEGYDEYNTGASFRSAAATSIAYCVMSRAIGDADRFFEPEDFLDIFDFNTQAAVNVLGCAVSDMSSQMFREIERTIRIVDRAKEAERSQIHDEHHLHEGRGLSAAGDSAGADADEAPGQVRQDAQSVSAGEQQPALQSPDPDREVVPAPLGDSGDRDSADGASDAGAAEEEPGTGQGEESAGLGAAHERAEDTGGGTGGDGAYNQLTFFGHIPTEAEQIEKIDSRARRQTLAESEQPSAFSISERELENVLRGGSGFANGRLRIYAMYRQQGDTKARSEFLKNEYGIGGRSYTFEDGTRGFVEYNSKGILVRSYEHDRQVNLRWPEVDKRLDRMIAEGRYLTEKEMAEVWEIEAEYGGELPAPLPAYSYPPIKPVEDPVLSAVDPEDNSFEAMNDEEIDELPISVELDGEVQTFPNADAAEEATLTRNVVRGKDANGKNIWGKETREVSNTELKGLLESYKEKNRSSVLGDLSNFKAEVARDTPVRAVREHTNLPFR